MRLSLLSYDNDGGNEDDDDDDADDELTPEWVPRYFQCIFSIECRPDAAPCLVIQELRKRSSHNSEQNKFREVASFLNEEGGREG